MKPTTDLLDAPRHTVALARIPAPVRSGVRWVLVFGAAFLIFAAFLVAKGADPIEVYESMWRSAFSSGNNLGETLMRATPILLAGLAVAVPARAGLFNIGGEGQLLLGAIGAHATATALGDSLPTLITLVLMAIGGATAGMMWALGPALLKRYTSTNETITSLLSNYLAAILLAWLVFVPWKDPQSLGQAYSTELTGPQSLPVLWGNRVNAGIVLAALVPVLLWLAFRYTPWGFKLKVIGGNPEAARRAGMAVGSLTVGAMAVGGALAGLGGMVEVAGIEGRLRPGMMLGYGYIGFLASWLARHHPIKIIAAAILLGGIAIGGNGLKITAGLSGAAVNVLMALVLLAVLGWGTRPSQGAVR
jgi:general nucleoside transport system permease protein